VLKYQPLTRGYQTVGRLMEAGCCQRVSHTEFVADVSGRCERPKRVELRYRPEKREKRSIINVRAPVTAVPMFLDIVVRCRRCPPCLKQRRAIWRERMIAECAKYQRNWFCTLTYRPEAHFRNTLIAVDIAAKAGVDYYALNADDQFRYQCRVVTRDIQLFVKRLRKNSRADLRYIAVIERHKSGHPHVHMIIHEVDVLKPVRYAVLSGAWHDGFSRFKLCDERTSRYISKYLTKDYASRVQCSVSYGRLPDYKSERPKTSSDIARLGALASSVKKNDTTLNPRLTKLVGYVLAELKGNGIDADSVVPCEKSPDPDP